MAIRIYAAESMTWRVAGLIESRMHGGVRGSASPVADGTHELKAIEEFATECSIVKVYASEMLDYVVDEGSRSTEATDTIRTIVERAYRDSRINRLFEGPRDQPAGDHRHAAETRRSSVATFVRGRPRSLARAEPQPPRLPAIRTWACSAARRNRAADAGVARENTARNWNGSKNRS